MSRLLELLGRGLEHDLSDLLDRYFWSPPGPGASPLEAPCREHPDRAVAYKCDLCDGTPQCVAFCQNPHVLAVDVRRSKIEREPASV